MWTFLPNFAIKKYSIYVAMFVIFVHNYVLDQDMKCTCEKEDELTCNLYMVLPFFILFTLQLWTDETFKRIWKYTCPACNGCYRCKFFLVLVFVIIKAVCVGLLWVLFLLIEGDWAVCCYNTNKEYPQLGCKDKQNITAKERALIGKLKNTSMLIGLGILLAGFFVVTFVLSIGWKECCGKKCSSCCDRKLLYDQMILEEEGEVLTEMLRKAAKEKLTENMKKKLDTERWGECFDVAEELIKNQTPPGKKDDIPLKDLHSERENLVKKDAGTS